MTTFQYRGGRYIERITVNVNDTEKYPTMQPYRIDLGNESLSMDATDASALAVALIEALYDRGELDMTAAERLNYLSHVVLQDPREALEAAMMQAGEDF